MNNTDYWNGVAHDYQANTYISLDEFHYGPLIPGDRQLNFLPEIKPGMRCLELGCGAAQNSIILAKRGADCVAFDNAREQLKHARELCQQEGVTVTLLEADLNEMATLDLGKFDLVHAAYSVPFATDPQALFQDVADLLVPQGSFLFSLGHPLDAAQWLEIEEEQLDGIFMHDYFNLEPDTRYDEQGHPLATSRYFTFETIFAWIDHAGLTLRKYAEPKPVIVEEEMSEEDLMKVMPYFSSDWLLDYEKYCRMPIISVFLCQKCENLL